MKHESDDILHAHVITDRLQRLLNAAARIVSNTEKFDRGLTHLLHSISSEWQFTGVSKARLPSTPWTAATPHWTLPVVSDFDLPAAIISSCHNIVAARSAVGRSPSPVRWPGINALPDDLRDASLSADNFRKTHLFRNALGHLSALEALRNALYKFKTYLLTYLLTCPTQFRLSNFSLNSTFM